LALAGVYGMAGFWAKDEILLVASQTGRTLVWLLGTFAAFLSAIYIGRLVFLAFFGAPRSEEAERAHESPAVMLAPLVVLAAGALGLGALMLDPEAGRLPSFLEPVLGLVPHGEEGLAEGALIVLSQVVAVGGLLVAWLVYGSGRIDWLALRTRVGSLQGFLASGMHVDELYASALVAPGKAGSAFLAYVVDARVLDGVVNGIGALVQRLAAAGRRVQTGLVRTYALGFLLGALALLVYMGVRA
jgi:NADH-quinone oxidoreductase subunit L